LVSWFFLILFYIQILKIYFQKIRKLLDVYIFRKLISPFFVEFFFLFGGKNNDQTANCIMGVTPYCKFKLKRIICFGPKMDSIWVAFNINSHSLSILKANYSSINPFETLYAIKKCPNLLLSPHILSLFIGQIFKKISFLHSQNHARVSF
jgi:hypothetical protein